MPFSIEFSIAALKELKKLRKLDQVKILDGIEVHLTYEPKRVSRSRIKRLKEILQPAYRLRIDEFRVYYDVDDRSNTVIVYGVVLKEDAQAWLDSHSKRMKEEEQE